MALNQIAERDTNIVQYRLWTLPSAQFQLSLAPDSRWDLLGPARTLLGLEGGCERNRLSSAMNSDRSRESVRVKNSPRSTRENAQNR